MIVNYVIFRISLYYRLPFFQILLIYKVDILNGQDERTLINDSMKYSDIN